MYLTFNKEMSFKSSYQNCHAQSFPRFTESEEGHSLWPKCNSLKFILVREIIVAFYFTTNTIRK